MEIKVILGPTSSGKTSLALDLCKKVNGEIISADSRQIFKYMDIGTGKLPLDKSVKVEKDNSYWRIDGVKIWGYDLVLPNEYFSAYDFALFALEKIKYLESQNKKTFITGGTGFYIDVLLGNVSVADTPPDMELRAELEKFSLAELQDKLFKLNMKVFSQVDSHNKVRLIRAIEKNITHKKNLKKEKFNFIEKNKFKIIGLTAPREHLYQRVDFWLDRIWENGLIEETQSLLNSEFKDSPKLHGLVYKSVISFIHGETKEDDAKQKAKYNLHAYIRRQQTYFKKMKNIEWIDITQDNYAEKLYNMLDG